jgi:hypothetical protein
MARNQGTTSRPPAAGRGKSFSWFPGTLQRTGMSDCCVLAWQAKLTAAVQIRPGKSCSRTTVFADHRPVLR